MTYGYLLDLRQLIDQGHYDVRLTLNEWERLVTWMDTYGQRKGSFSKDQENRLRDLRKSMTAMGTRPR